MEHAIALLILGAVVSFNFIVIIKKWKNKRYFDTILDCGILMLISFLFCGTFSGFVVGNIASFCISLWLFFNPVTFKVMNPLVEEGEDEDYDEDD